MQEFQANHIRLEVLVHLVCAFSRGLRKATSKRLDHYLNSQLGNSPIAMLEDPCEEVSVGNLELASGNYRVFLGIWEGADWHLQQILNVAQREGAPPWAEGLLAEARSLLAVSDHMAEFRGLKRYVKGEGIPKERIEVPSEGALEKLASDSIRAVEVASAHELDAKGLLAFEVALGDFAGIENESIGASRLARRPIVRIGSLQILALPTAVSLAIRHTFIEAFDSRRQLGSLVGMIREAQTSECFDLPSHVTRGARIQATPEGWVSGRGIEERLFRFDDDKVAHLVLLSDEPKKVIQEGFASISAESEVGERSIRHVERASRKLLELPDCGSGFSLIVFGGFGGGQRLSLPVHPHGWYTLHVSLSDWILWCQDNDCSLLTLWKLVRNREEIARSGVEIVDVNGGFNLYAFWKEQNYRLVPKSVSYPTENLRVMIPTDSIEKLRRETRQSTDLHSVWFDSGRVWVPVARALADSFFEEDRGKAIFFANRPVREGCISAVIERGRTIIWIHVRVPRDGWQYGFIQDLWQSALNRFHDLIGNLVAAVPSIADRELSFTIELAGFEKIDLIESSIEASGSEPVLVEDGTGYRIVIQPGFLNLIQRVENDGERALMLTMIRGAVTDQGRQLLSDADVEGLVSVAMGGPHSRYAHILHSKQPRDGLRHHFLGEPPMIPLWDIEASKLGLGFLVSGVDSELTIEGKGACCGFLTDLVDKLWERIESRLRQSSRVAAVTKLLRRVEHIGFDEDTWNRTTRAQAETHRNRLGVVAVARQREHRRSAASLCYRVAIEMAVCTSPPDESLPASDSDLDEISADILSLIDMAHLSDAIHYELAEPKLEISKSGEVLRDVSYLEKIVGPYAEAYFADYFMEKYDAYDTYFDTEPTVAIEQDSSVPDDLVAAFQAEYEISVDDYVVVSNALQRLGVSLGDPVPRVRRSQILERLALDGVEAQVISRYLDAFVFRGRNRWDKAPDGFAGRDWYPWKYRRRLSVLTLPLVLVEDSDDPIYAFGVGLLDRSTRYLLSRCEKGWLPEEFFGSPRMRSWIGSVNDRMGTEFEESVRFEFQSAGWEARSRVEMSELGGSPADGDVDVLAWDSKRNRVAIVECKRLQFAMTIGEIGEQLQRFKGESKDELSRHLGRVKFLKANRSEIVRITGIHADQIDFQSLLVTNSVVPMSYAESLSLPASGILPLAQLTRRLSRVGKKRRRRKRK